MKKILLISLLFFSSFNNTTTPPQKRDSIRIKNNVFEVWYNEIFEQPIKLIYSSTNKPKIINRNNIDFHIEKNIHTSNKYDYINNIYDKGHLAPAESFSDTKENLLTTFSYLNCSLQNFHLNRGQWKQLEQQERLWDNTQNLTITINLIFNPNHLILPSGAHVPDTLVKHIFFHKSNTWTCYKFPNTKLNKKWHHYQTYHNH